MDRSEPFYIATKAGRRSDPLSEETIKQIRQIYEVLVRPQVYHYW